MNRAIHSTLTHISVSGALLAAFILTLAMLAITVLPVSATLQLPVLWTAGGLSAGCDSAGQAARIASDPNGNVAAVSGPSSCLDLAVTSYTANGSLRWNRTVSPSIGTFVGDWVEAAPNGDFVAVGHNVTSSGNPIAITIVRYASDGTLLWRADLTRTLPAVARLLVDSAGNAYLAFNSVGDGQDIQLHKYSPSGALLWGEVISTGPFANDIATSLALSPDESEVALTGDIVGGAAWITALYDAATGTRKWLVNAPEGTAALDVVMDGARVYVTGRGNIGINEFLTVVAYDRATGEKLWRKDKKPSDSTGAAGLRIDKSPDGSLVVAGQAARGFLDWYTVAFETSGSVRWEAVRDGGLNTNEIPRGVLVLSDGTTVVTGRGGPNLPGGFIPGVTVGYSSNGTLLWEAFSNLETVWATALPGGVVCATGGYDALITCWLAPPNSPTPTTTITPTPTNTPMPGGNELHIAGIDMAVVSDGNNRFHAQALVTVHNENNQPSSGATVSGSYSGDSSSSPSGVTNAAGQVVLSSSIVRNGANWNFCVTNITKPGFSYDPDSNLETCDQTGSPTATPTVTATPTPTATPGPGGTMHIGDLDALSAPGPSGSWSATVTINVHTGSHTPVGSVTVSGNWSNGSSGSGSCVTNSLGQCSVTKTGIRPTVSSVTLTVTNVTGGPLTYQPGGNHDPEGDSNGTVITVNKP
ncbi:MAG TPA: PQQ-binding-like beta-propeller repeat protein [Anaerolineales bacterium]|nr:PQQ-binding-like beta-propeller repeat protein [Anaerolineales bacterium]